MLLSKSPEFRRNEMIMLEEFRRRKNMKQFWELRQKHHEEYENPGQDFKNKRLG